jgi:hypothetical protein
VLISPFDLKKQEREGLLEILERKSVCFVPFSGWEMIDSKETMAGQLVQISCVLFSMQNGCQTSPFDKLVHKKSAPGVSSIRKA